MWAQLPYTMSGCPLPTSPGGPGSAYQLLNAQGDGLVPGVDDGL
jgi:hypothetical protein